MSLWICHQIRAFVVIAILIVAQGFRIKYMQGHATHSDVGEIGHASGSYKDMKASGSGSLENGKLTGQPLKVIASLLLTLNPSFALQIGPAKVRPSLAQQGADHLTSKHYYRVKAGWRGTPFTITAHLWHAPPAGTPRWAIGHRVSPRAVVMNAARDDSIPALPPAVARDVASEARIAAEVERCRSGKHPDDQAPVAAVRPLMVLDMIQTATDGAKKAKNFGGKFRQLVGEQIDRIEQGSNAGTTWFRPLALRSCSNASLAQAAFKYDPAIGWQAHGGNADVMSDEVHVFSALAPPTFVPTPLLREAAPVEAVVVRLLWEAHCVDEAPDVETADAVQAEEMRTLQALLRDLVAEHPAAFAAIGQSPTTTE